MVEVALKKSIVYWTMLKAYRCGGNCAGADTYDDGSQIFIGDRIWLQIRNDIADVSLGTGAHVLLDSRGGLR
jgi:hypothetical protein